MALAEAAVDVAIDVDRLERQARAEIGQAARRAGEAFDEGFKRRTRDTGDDAGSQVASDITSRMRLNRPRFERAGTQAGKAAGDGFSDGFSRAVNFELATKALTVGLSPLRGIGKALGFSVIATQAAAAAASMLQFATALAPAAGILVAFPSAIALGAAALGTMKLALQGVSDVFSSAITDNTEDFEKAIEHLAPALQSVAREVRALAPDLLALRNEVQQAFFAQLEGQLTAVAAVLLGPMQTGMSGVAAAFGQGAAEVANFLQQSASVAFISNVFDSARQSVEAFIPALQPLLAGLRDIAVVGLSLFPQFAGSIAHASAEFGEFLSQAAASGQALSWLSGALTLFRSLGDIVNQVGQLLTSVFRAASETGGDLVGSLDSALQVLNQFAQSAEGQQALIEIFRTLGVVGQQLGQVIAAVAQGLGGLAPIIGQIAIALGPALLTAVNALAEGLAGLGPGLIPLAEGLAAAFAALGPALGPLGVALGDLLAALSPLLPVLGELAFVLVDVLTKAINGLLPILRPLIVIFADQLARNLPDLLPVLLDLTDAFVQLAVALAPLAIVGSKVYVALSNIALTKAAVPILAGIADAVRVLAVAISFAEKGLIGFVSALIQIPAFLGRVVTAISTFVSQIPAFFASLPGRILAFLQSLPGRLVAFFGSLFAVLLPALETGFLSVLTFFAALPGRIIGAVFGLIALWIDFVTTFWATVIGLIVVGGDAVVSFFFALPGRIMAAVNALPGLIATFFTNLWNTAVAVVQQGISSVLSTIASLPGQIASLAGRFQNAGTSLIRGLFTGLEAVGNFAGTFATKVVAAIKSGINKGIDAINSGINKINGKLPGSPIPNIPRFARGGIIDQATLGIIGEAGPELIMPLKPSMRKRAMGLAKKSGAYQMIVNDYERSRQQPAVSQHTETHNHFHITNNAGDPEIMAQKIIGRMAQRVGR